MNGLKRAQRRQRPQRRERPRLGQRVQLGQRIQLTNGFNSANGWTSNNGLNSINGLNSANGLNSVNGLHVAYTFDGTTHKLYVDGAVVNTSTLAPDAHVVTRAQLGAFNGGSSFNGWLDDIRIYNVALSATQVANLAAGNASDSLAISCTVGSTVGLQSMQNNMRRPAQTTATTSWPRPR